MTAAAAYLGFAYIALTALVCAALVAAGWYGKAFDIADKQRRQEKAWADYKDARERVRARDEEIPGSTDMEECT